MTSKCTYTLVPDHLGRKYSALIITHQHLARRNNQAPVPDDRLGARINILYPHQILHRQYRATYAPLLANMYVCLTRRMQA